MVAQRQAVAAESVAGADEETADQTRSGTQNQIAGCGGIGQKQGVAAIIERDAADIGNQAGTVGGQVQNVAGPIAKAERTAHEVPDHAGLYINRVGRSADGQPQARKCGIGGRQRVKGGAVDADSDQAVGDGDQPAAAADVVVAAEGTGVGADGHARAGKSAPVIDHQAVADGPGAGTQDHRAKIGQRPATIGHHIEGRRAEPVGQVLTATIPNRVGQDRQVIVRGPQADDRVVRGVGHNLIIHDQRVVAQAGRPEVGACDDRGEVLIGQHPRVIRAVQAQTADIGELADAGEIKHVAGRSVRRRAVGAPNGQNASAQIPSARDIGHIDRVVGGVVATHR